MKNKIEWETHFVAWHQGFELLISPWCGAWKWRIDFNGDDRSKESGICDTPEQAKTEAVAWVGENSKRQNKVKD